MPGVLASQQIREMIRNGAIRAETPVEDGQVQPASLDLRLGSTAYRVRASFLAGHDASISERLAEFEMHRFDLTDGAVLEKGCVYVVPLIESLNLPKDTEAFANAKSSTGRLDLLTRAIADRGDEFDRIPKGYRGTLYAQICPLSFSVLVRPRMTLNQIRFRRGCVELDDKALKNLHKRKRLVDTPPKFSDGLCFSVDLKTVAQKDLFSASSAGDTIKPRRTEGTLVGYRAKPHAGLVDLRKTDSHDPLDYWDEIHSADGRTILDPGAFYILASREAVHIPPTHAAEMAPYMAMAGEFRVHYAGFFDPGFGHDAAGGAGSRAVLEVRCRDAPFVLEHGQVVGRLIFEKMDQKPDLLYGGEVKSNYQGQGLKLGKHFKTPG